MYNKIKKLLLLSGDVSIMYLSLYLSLFLRYKESFNISIWNNHYRCFSFIFLVWIFIFYISGLYNLYITQNDKIFFRLSLKSLGIAGIIATLFFYLNPSIGIAPKINLIIYLLVFTLTFLLWRTMFNSLLNSYLPKNRVIYIGFNNQIQEIIKFIKNNPGTGYKSILLLDLNDNVPQSFSEIEIIKSLNNLPLVIKSKNINTIVLSSNPGNSNTLRQELFSSLSLSLEFVNSVNFYENVINKIPIDAINQMWFLENLNEGSKVLFDRIKRVFDFLFAGFIFFLTLPLWIIFAILIKYESKGPVFFMQNRLGKNNKNFRIIKFRTMRTENNDLSPTKVNDSRITKTGSFLRRTRLDELPQVINIIKGEMSFVGPRPEQPNIVEKLEQVIPFYKERMLVNPGLTGWDQVSGEYHSPSEEDTLKKLQYDLFYVKNRSFYLDASILLKTISVVFSRAGM